MVSGGGKRNARSKGTTYTFTVEIVNRLVLNLNLPLRRESGNFNIEDKMTSYRKELRELVRYLEMGRGAFGASAFYLEPNCHGWVDAEVVTKFIVEQTKLWRETWILPKLRRLLEREERRSKARVKKLCVKS